MLIRYENKIDDLVAFNMYVYRHSPSQRRSRTIAWLGFPLAFVGLGLYVAIRDHSIDVFFFFGAPALIWGLVVPIIYDKVVIRRIQKICRESSLRGFTGVKELELLDDRLVSRSESSSSTYELKAVEQIVETDTHAFLLMNSLMGIVIPHAFVLQGDLKGFLQEIVSKGQIPFENPSPA